MFKYLRLSITDRCNFRCVYCMPEEGICKQSHAEILRYEEMLAVVKASVKCGVEQVRITGGEPLVRSGVVDFVKELAQIDGLKDLCLTTNASKLAEMAKALKNAGLHRVNISLDSLNAEAFKKITRVGDLNLVLKGINAAIDVGLMPVKLNVVLVPGQNDCEILDFAEFARKHPVTVRFIERMPFAGGKEDSGFISEETVFAKISKVYSLQPDQQKDSFGPARTFSISDGMGKVGFISPRSSPYCKTCQRLRLTANGFLLPCLDSTLGVQVRHKNETEIVDIIKELHAKKASWNKSRACFGSTFDSSLSKIGG